jgi:hypothetical protein
VFVVFGGKGAAVPEGSRFSLEGSLDFEEIL